MRHLKLFESKDKDRLIDIIKDAVIDIQDEYDVKINDSQRSVHISIEKPNLLRRSQVGGVTYNDPMSASELAKFYRSVSNLWEMITELISRTEDHFDRVEMIDADNYIFIKFCYSK